MTTASKPSGSGSPVSTVAKSPEANSSGVVGVAPTVVTARTAIPSMAAVSYAGEERRAQTASAVTRPIAASSRKRSCGTRAGHPAAEHASSHAASACAAGRSRMNGSAIERHLDLGVGGKAGRGLVDDDESVGGGEDREQRRRSEERRVG